MFRMKDEMGGDDKVLCIPVADQRQAGIKELTDMPSLSLLEIEHFFQVYKDLEPGKSV
ncbi:MAG TPA: inorganic pyrophosphatase, partial [Propionibacteriaceae bacterium]|nr:inorganic pyrophosphatase [Propionibacteriaceae bacterium]